MNTTSLTHTSNSQLLALAEQYKQILHALERSIYLPHGYQFSVFSNTNHTYGISIICTDQENNLEFDHELMTGSLEQTTQALHLLTRLGSGIEASRSDYVQNLTATTHSLTPRKPEPDSWLSRYTNIHKPTLILEHTPGWCHEDIGDKTGYYLFKSTNEAFGMEFSVIENEDCVNISLLPTGWDWDVQTPEELLQLSDQGNQLQTWLDDCATVTAWARAYDKEQTHE